MPLPQTAIDRLRAAFVGTDPTQGDGAPALRLQLVGTITFSSVTLSAQNAITFTHASARIIPGATSLSFRNNANDADNLVIADAGAVTFRSTLSTTFTDAATTGAKNSVNVAPTYSAAAISGTQTGVNILLIYSGATSAVDLRAVFAVAQSSGAGTVSTLFGVYGRVSKSGTGVVSFGYAHYGVIQNTNASGAITDGYCYYAATPSATGPITTAYGLNVENQGQANVTHAYGIWIRAQSTAVTTNVGLRNDGTSIFHGLVTVDASFTPQPGGSTGLQLGNGSTAPKLCTGSGAPTMSAAKGSLYLRTDGSSTSTRAYINSDGGTTWVAVTTAS